MRTGRLILFLLLALRPAWAGDFEFVVIGDTRPRFESQNFQVFEGLIRKINAAKPTFVINLGDLIYGYAPLSKEGQWDKYQQVIKAVESRYYQVPGNHDTHSKQARKIYGRRFGKFYDSFDYADCHFVLLDNTENERWGYLGPAQLEWLKNDLKQTQARSVFVFMHFPVWEPERVAPSYYDFWEQTLHPLFKHYRVRAVFGGHYHSYGPSREYDGIRYFITGGGGAELRPEYRKSGGVHHFVKVKVSGDQFALRVVTDRGELTDAEADIMGGLQFADQHASRIGISSSAPDLRAGVPCSVALDNPYQGFLSGKAEWAVDASAFDVQPKSISVRLPPGGRQSWTFTLKPLKDTVLLQSLPRLEFDVSAGGRRLRFHRDAFFLQTIRAPYRAAPPVLDGRLVDWDGIPLQRLGEASKPGAELRAARDAEALYLAVTVPVVKSQEEDEAAFADDLQVGIAGRQNDTEFGHDLLRLGFNHASGEAKDRAPGRKTGTTVPGVRMVCNTAADRTTYEIAVPVRLLRPLRTSGPSRLVVNLSFPLPADGAETAEPAEPNPNSFAYQIRYGADELVPVHFVELLLDRRPR